MRAHPLRIGFLAASALALLALGGCVYPGYYAQPGYYNQPGYSQPGYYGDATVVAPYAPPPVVAESYGVAPFPGAIWIGGYWNWNGGRHVWSPGRWEHPRSGYRWVPRTWEQHGNQWHQRGGQWQRG